MLANVRPNSFALFIKGTRAGVHSPDARLVDDIDLQVIVHANLAGKPHVRRELGFQRQTVTLKFSHLTRIAFEQFNPASGAASVAAAAMKNVDSGIFNYQYQLLSFERFYGLGSA